MHKESCKGNVHVTKKGSQASGLGMVGSTLDWTVSPDQAQWWPHPWHRLARLRQMSKGGVSEEDQPWFCCKLTLRSQAKPFLCLGLSSPNSMRKGLGQLR